MPSVLLVRHGQASFGADDYDVLSALGHRQADVVAARLDALPGGPARVLTGRMRRQIDTAAPLVARREVTVERDGRLDEYDHEDLVARAIAAVPELTEGTELGAHLAAVDDPKRTFQAVLEVALRRWVEGEEDGFTEPYAAFRARTRAAVADVAGALDGSRTAAVVTSGGVIAAIAADALGLDPAGWARLNTVIVNTSVTRLVIGRRGTTLVSLNDHAHLEHDPSLITYR